MSTIYHPTKEPVTLTLDMVNKELRELEYISFIQRYIYVFRSRTGRYHIYNSKTWKEEPQIYTNEASVRAKVLGLNEKLTTEEFLDKFNKYQWLLDVKREFEAIAAGQHYVRRRR